MDRRANAAFSARDTRSSYGRWASRRLSAAARDALARRRRASLGGDATLDGAGPGYGAQRRTVGRGWTGSRPDARVCRAARSARPRTGRSPGLIEHLRWIVDGGGANCRPLRLGRVVAGAGQTVGPPGPVDRGRRSSSGGSMTRAAPSRPARRPEEAGPTRARHRPSSRRRERRRPPGQSKFGDAVRPAGHVGSASDPRRPGRAMAGIGQWVVHLLVSHRWFRPGTARAPGRSAPERRGGSARVEVDVVDAISRATVTRTSRATRGRLRRTSTRAAPLATRGRARSRERRTRGSHAARILGRPHRTGESPRVSALRLAQRQHPGSARLTPRDARPSGGPEAALRSPRPGW